MKRKIDDILPQGQETYSPKEVAAYLRDSIPTLNTSTVLRWCQNGKIEAEKPIGRWNVTRTALAKLLVAFGLASHLLATGMSSSPKHLPSSRVSYHRQMLQEAENDGWNLFDS